MNSKVVLPIIGVVSLAAIVSVWIFRPLPTAIRRDNAERIKVGMAMADVVAILGEARDEVTGPTSYLRYWGGFQLGKKNGHWISEHIHVRIGFDPSTDAVVDVEISEFEFESQQEHLWWRVRRAVGQAPDVELPIRTYYW